MGNAEKIISNAKKEMRDMLRDVYNYNSRFAKNKEQKKLLEEILVAMSVIDRKFFYSGEGTYYDIAMSIGEGQTISQPSTVARMLLLSDLKKGDDVLEVGTGSGWNACLIAYLISPGQISSIERIEKLKVRAEENLNELRKSLIMNNKDAYEKLERIEFYAENIFFPEKIRGRKYDKVIITAGIDSKQEEKIQELAELLLKKEGVLICPYMFGPLTIYEKNGKLRKKYTGEQYSFVPLLP